ncbi:hypothetical protein FGB62_29g133 [Gracilaria domingensis]|nr:hypothetical protein FGB62_29g133 [Gracilaria domingensis]
MERGHRREFIKNMLDKHGKPILQSMSRLNNPGNNHPVESSPSNPLQEYYSRILNGLNQFSSSHATSNNHSPPMSSTGNPFLEQLANLSSNPYYAPHAASAPQPGPPNATLGPQPGAPNPPSGPQPGAPNAADYGPQRPPPERSSLIPNVVEQAYTRPHSARVKLGGTAVEEACKGLSRVLYPGDGNDIQKFGSQLSNSDRGAIAEDYLSCLQQRVPCFAVSYVQTKPVSGRFKFSDAQWQNLHVALRTLSENGVTECRLWLDQCLWLRDASQGAWAHTGILPYVLWPVISLGDRVMQGERTTASYERMWPFVEEVAGLWSLGVLVTSEMRGKEVSQGVRRSLSYNIRVKMEPEETMKLLLFNIFHGATDGLKTGWQEDVKELQEMARWNVECSSQDVIVGVDWRTRIAGYQKQPRFNIITGLQLQRKMQYFANSQNIFLDGSRKYARGSWSGFDEWVSGNEVGTGSQYDHMFMNLNRSAIYNVLTDKGEFQLLNRGSMISAIWLLVAMDGRSSGALRGRVAWTKVISGQASCLLPGNTGGDTRVISLSLSEQLGVPVKVFSVQIVQGNPEWC